MIDEKQRRLSNVINKIADRRLQGDGKMSDEEYVLDEYDEQMMDNEMKKWSAYQQKKQRQMAETAQAKVFQETMKEVAREHDMSEAELGEVLGACPFPDAEESLKQNLRQHMKNMISRSKSPKARRERDHDGRFVSSKSQASSSSRTSTPRDNVDDVIKNVLKKAGRSFLP